MIPGRIALDASAAMSKPSPPDREGARSRSEGDSRSENNICCSMEADLPTIEPEASLKTLRCRQTDASKHPATPSPRTSAG